MAKMKLSTTTTPLIGIGAVAVVLVLLCGCGVVTSYDISRNSIPGNETILSFDNINATGQFIKRVGEFASRTLWMRRGKFVLPAGTILTLAPKITIPAFRRKAFRGGLNSDFQATWYFYLNADKMGFTHDMHPFPFDRPPFYPFGSLMRPIESKDYPGQEKDKDKDKNKDKPIPMKQWMKPLTFMQGGPPDDGYVTIQSPAVLGEAESYKTKDNSDKVFTYFPIVNKRTGEESKVEEGPKKSRKPRSIMSLPPPDNIPGGERAVLLPSVENMLSNFGYEGKGCMLRAICEIHEFPMQEGYGLFGEMIALFFSVSQSPYAESHMPEYLKAEEAGRKGGFGCSEYRKKCSKSIFKWEMEKRQLPLLQELEEKKQALLSNLVEPYMSKFQSESDDH